MRQYRLTCKYCGHIWFREFFLSISTEDVELECPKCEDTNLKVKEIEKVDYYK